MIDPFDLQTAPLGEPLSITKGQHEQWARDIDLDATLFTLAYVHRRRAGDTAGQTALDQTIAITHVSGSRWAADITAAQSGAYEAGEFFWDLIVTRVSDDATKIIDTGEIRVWDTTEDRRSHAQIMVTKIESLLAGRADQDIEAYTIKQRSITKMAVEELRQWRDYYLREASNEPVVNGGLFQRRAPNKSTIGVRFR